MQDNLSYTSECTSHKEEHFENQAIIKDLIIGVSDGLTVPFALAAGISSISEDTHFIVVAGIAEIIAGSISMGLGGYLCGKSEIEHYNSEKEKEYREIIEKPNHEEQEIYEIFEKFHIKKEHLTDLMNILKNDHTAWVDFMMKFELNLEEPDSKRPFISAITIASGYFISGIYTLFPYLFIKETFKALYVSIGITCFALFLLGFLKVNSNMLNRLKSAFHTTFIGILAAGAAFGITYFINKLVK